MVDVESRHPIADDAGSRLRAQRRFSASGPGRDIWHRSRQKTKRLHQSMSANSSDVIYPVIVTDDHPNCGPTLELHTRHEQVNTSRKLPRIEVNNAAVFGMTSQMKQTTKSNSEKDHGDIRVVQYNSHRSSIISVSYTKQRRRL
ncbi:hypothetical protein LSAT2_002583 [Lamellibrachia satsuma]|nr:hypothetical protein LSAT2_002583 [Lamellibrachia satsuma]